MEPAGSIFFGPPHQQPHGKHHPLSSQALSISLSDAANCLQAVGEGHSLTDTLDALPGSRRPSAQALAFHALRHWGRARTLRRALTKPSTAADLASLIDVALSLLLTQDDADAPRYDPHTLVNQAVEAAKANPALRHAAPMVNAVLRRVLREPALTQPTTLEAQWNHPAWWVKALQKDWPQHWPAILAANQTHPPMTLRVNAQQGSREAYADRLTQAGLSCTTPAPDALTAQALSLGQPVPVALLPGFASGACSVQDLHAQMAAPLLLQGLQPAGPAWRVLDACAAPGGKTAHLLELLGTRPAAATDVAPEVWALDRDPARLTRVATTLARLQMAAKLVAADAGKPADWWDGHPFDAVLLDAPCTASGIVRRHPDVRWLRRPSDISQLASEQTRLLDALWPLVRPGGRLLYCTCSVFKAEGQHQAEAFLSRHKDALLEPSPGHLLPESINDRSENTTSGSKISGDGFFYALFTKT
jgi:16S rRNA (cytosine967-C5)-methyltransferase